MDSRFKKKTSLRAGGLLLTLLLLGFVVRWGVPRQNEKTGAGGQTSAMPVRDQVVANRSGNQASRPLPDATQIEEAQKHPFAVAHESAAYQWTAADGKDTNIIRRLAHNDLEYERMVKENPTIYRRQLVYHKAGFTLQAQQAVQSGQSIRQVTLPGLDGQELSVAVTKTDLESGGDRGIFYGKLPDRPDSLVTVAFINGREAFTVVSPQDQLYLHAESHEPGELVVKSVDPKTYGGGVCGNK
jgi:hypothetical protein